MKTLSRSRATKQFLKRHPASLAVFLILCSLLLAPQVFGGETSSFSNWRAPEQEKQKATQPKKKAAATSNPRTKKPQNTDDDKEGETGNLKENFETAKEAYEKVGAKIASGEYGEALDGAANMAKDKMIEKAEEALKKKNETLYKAYKYSKDIKDDLQKGDYEAVWKKTKETAYDEAKEYVEDKIIEKMIPGYGQMKTAWDTGYAGGTWLGKQSISPDGETINQVAEKKMTSVFYGGQDSESDKATAQAEVVIALARSVKKGDYKLPDHMTFSDASQIIRENMTANRSPFDGFRAWEANEVMDKYVTDETIVAPVYKDGVVIVPIAKPVASLPVDAVPPNSDKKAVPAAEDDPWAAGPDPAAIKQPIKAEPREAEQDAWADGGDADQALQDQNRYRLERQLAQNKAQAAATNDRQNRRRFAQAENKREEEARIKEKKRREWAEFANAFTGALTQVATEIERSKNTNSGSHQSVQVGDYSAANAYDKKVQDCVNNSGRPGFAVTDVHAAQIGCSQKLGPRPQPIFRTQAGSGSPNFDGLVNDPAARINSYSNSGGNSAGKAGYNSDWGDEDPIEQASVIYAGDPEGYYADDDKMHMVCGVDIKRGGWTFGRSGGYYVLKKPEEARKPTANSRGAPPSEISFYPNCQKFRVLTQTGGDGYSQKLWYKNGTIQRDGIYWSYNWAKLEKIYREDGTLSEVTKSTGADHKRQYGLTATTHDKNGNAIRTETYDD